MTPFQRIAVAALVLLGLTRCALYSDVSIGPLVVAPAKLDRGSDVQSMVKKADYLRALEMAVPIDGRIRKNAADLVSLGHAELAAGRYDSARKHLRAAIELQPFRSTYGEAAWHLSQVEYMSNSFETSLEWARTAVDNGIAILPWHLQYLEELATIPVYRFSGLPSDEMPLKIGRPDVPRVDVRVNRSATPVTAVIDSGAVLSIMSERMASSLSVRRLRVSNGTFYGLLNEPIPVQFGVVDSLEIGAVVVENVPIAIMPDEKMRFVVAGKREFRIDFLLGANLLKEFRIDLTFSRNRVSFTRLNASDRHPAQNQNLFFENFRPNVRATINKHGWYLFVLDTGSEITYLNQTRIAGLPINSFTPRVHSATLQGLGGSKKRGSKVEKVEIGVDKWAGSFRTIPMYAAEEHERSVGIVGENFLKQFDVVLDFGRMRLDLKRW
ncbi:MAG: retroviral-like aspartic protease family protein [Thermoanaerobaculia bacterium]|nr:retroviral-like aspartic protease family protein [Thermoanaerobaculia bacterium]